MNTTKIKLLFLNVWSKFAAFAIGAFIAILLVFGLFNCIYGGFISHNSWQVTTGTFQIFSGILLIDRNL